MLLISRLLYNPYFNLKIINGPKTYRIENNGNAIYVIDEKEAKVLGKIDLDLLIHESIIAGSEDRSFIETGINERLKTIIKSNPLPMEKKEEEIVGFRAFLVLPQGKGHRLVSLLDKYCWEKGKNEAKCPISSSHFFGEPAPVHYCSCGFYSFKKFTNAVTYAGSHFLSYYNRAINIVYAKTSNWGKVIEHELGFRSQYAQIEELYFSDKIDEAIIRNLANYYDCLWSFIKEGENE